MSDNRDILHKIRNHLGALQTFLELAPPPDKNEKLKRLHQTSKENLEAIKKLLSQINR